jgi:LysR family glycine cleavage system transcriptional activator
MRLTPNLNAARAFEAAARHESFARAAGELGVTQAAVSRHVRNLEEELGFALFERGHRSISLTPEGRGYADRLAEGFAIISNAGNSSASGRPKRVVLDIDSDLAVSWLLPRLSNAVLSEMQVELDLRSRLDWPRHLPSDSDLAIVWGGYESPGFQSRPYLKSTAFVISAPMLEGGVAPPEDPTLFGNYCLIHERTDGWWRKIMAKAGVHPASSRNIYFHRTYLIADAAARGLGLAVACFSCWSRQANDQRRASDACATGSWPRPRLTRPGRRPLRRNGTPWNPNDSKACLPLPNHPNFESIGLIRLGGDLGKK